MIIIKQHNYELKIFFVAEALRLHPAAMTTEKLCTKNYTINNDNHAPVTIEVGTPIIIPTYALHRDEKHFKNPTKFDPERFAPENKNNITKCTFMPFGEGPRACLGKYYL